MVSTGACGTSMRRGHATSSFSGPRGVVLQSQLFCEGRSFACLFRY